jgi:hypothetical protein
MRFFDWVFEMQDGYVLDFSDRTFAEFSDSELAAETGSAFVPVNKIFASVI